MPQRWPRSHSTLTLLLSKAKAGTHLSGGLCKCGPTFPPHTQRPLPVSSLRWAGQWESVPGSLQSSLYPLPCQSPHRDRGCCRDRNGPTAISILLPHWPFSCFCKVDPEPFSIFLGAQTKQDVVQCFTPSQGNFSATNQGCLDKACDGLKPFVLSPAEDMLHVQVHLFHMVPLTPVHGGF